MEGKEGRLDSQGKSRGLCAKKRACGDCPRRVLLKIFHEAPAHEGLLCSGANSDTGYSLNCF